MLGPDLYELGDVLSAINFLKKTGTINIVMHFAETCSPYCCRRLDTITANMQLEHNAEIADCLAITKQLKDNLQSLVAATDQCVLLKLSREQLVQLQESFSCVICKGET